MRRLCPLRPRLARRGAPLVLVVATLIVTLPPRPARAQRNKPRQVRQADIPISLSIGAKRLVRFKAPIDRIRVSDPRIADAQTQGKRLLRVLGKRPGEATILVWDALGLLTRVLIDVSSPTAGLSAKLRALFPSDRMRVHAVGATVVLSGTVGDPVTVKRASAVAEAYVRSRGGKAKVLNFLGVKGRQQVQLRVKIAEVARRSLRQVGMNAWFRRGESYAGGLLSAGTPLGAQTAPNLGTTGNTLQPGGSAMAPQVPDNTGTGTTTTGVPPLAHIAGPLSSAFGLHFASGGNTMIPLSIALNLLQGHGLAKVLSEPTLVAYSGEKASFLAGGEFPIPIPQGLGQTTVQFKKFGVQLEFTPVVLRNRSIQCRVMVSVSERDTATSVSLQGTQVPALVTRHAATTVRMRSGQSFAIAGLLQDRVSSTSLRVPLLGDIPILGMLFRQSTFEREERELVILVTAHLVRPLKPGEVPLLPGENEIADPGAVAFFLLGSTDPQLKDDKKSDKRAAGAAGPVGYSK
ncbi:MAG: type II and III secretion system protein family protein [Myxococcales bacterium]|nr:type II and III secretion system protein family protein [Myxococcales bacterium]